MGHVFSTFLIARHGNPWLTAGGFFLFGAGQIEDRPLVFQSVIEGGALRLDLTHFSTLSTGGRSKMRFQAVHTLRLLSRDPSGD